MKRKLPRVRNRVRANDPGPRDPMLAGDVAAELGVHRVTVYQWTAAGLIPAAWRVDRYEYERADILKTKEKMRAYGAANPLERLAHEYGVAE
jgi:hypothetical protein